MDSQQISPTVKSLLWFSLGFFILSFFFFGYKNLSKGKLQTKITETKKVTFLFTLVDSEEKFILGAHVSLLPQEKKCLLAFFNPLSRFEDSSQSLMSIKNPKSYLQDQIQKITGQEPNYTIEMKEESLVRIIDLIGGISIFFDEATLKSSPRFERKSYSALLPGDDAVDSIVTMNSKDPLEFVARMEKQKSFFLTLIDTFRTQTEKFPKDWIEFSFSLMDTELSYSEFLNIIAYLSQNSVSMAFMDFPGELTNDPKTREPYLQVRNNTAAIATKNFEREIRSEIFGEGENARVEILNTTDINGLAKRAKTYLNDKRIKVLSVDTSKSFKLKETIILDRSGNTEYSQKVSEVLGGKKIYHVLRKDLGLDTTVLLGEDFRIAE